MKDDKEHIDKLFESLNDREFPIPEAFLEDLNKRLDDEPKRNKFFFLWFLSPLVLIGAVGIGYFLFSDKSAMKSPVNQENKLTAKDESKADSKSHPDNYRDQDTYHTNGQSQNSKQSVDSTAVSLQPRNTQVNTSKNTKQQTKSPHSIQLAQTKLKTKNVGQKSHAKIHTGKQTPGKKSEKTLQKYSNTETLPSEMGSKLLLNTNNKEKAQDKITPTSTPELKSSSTVEKLSKDSIAKKETDSAIAQNTIDSTQQTDPIQVEKDKITSKSLTGDWKKEIQLFAGLGGNSMHDSSKNPEYLAKINQNQSSILAPSFGVNANLSYKKFTFGLGVKYEQTGEKFKVDIKSTELKDSTYSEFIQDSIWVQDSTGNWFQIPHDTTIYHTVQYMDSSWISKSFQNRYSWISIPLHFGYRFELGNYELIPRLGAVFNFGITQGMGSYPNTSFNNANRYKPVKFNISYLIQLEARRNFDKCFVFVNPYFQSMINPSVSGDLIRRRYSSWGMQFGIGFKL